MNEPKRYPDISQAHWAKTCQIMAVAGFSYYLLINVSVLLANDMRLTFFVWLYVFPTLFVVGLGELLVLLITLQSWRRWQNAEQRTLTLLYSGAFLLFFSMQIAAHL